MVIFKPQIKKKRNDCDYCPRKVLVILSNDKSVIISAADDEAGRFKIIIIE